MGILNDIYNKTKLCKPSDEKTEKEKKEKSDKGYEKKKSK